MGGGKGDKRRREEGAKEYQAYATQATSNHIQDDLKKQLEELQEAKGHWVAKEGCLSDNVRALESQLSQEKKRVFIYLYFINYLSFFIFNFH